MSEQDRAIISKNHFVDNETHVYTKSEEINIERNFPFCLYFKKL